ncbi:MAG TPA: carboxypeptidase-like regulatory domain-containing protein [Chitinophagales bacterium]|nr:carboxypeptidase-like regulatory domain-containing protein [Chitinophagales bacterium]
MRKLFPILFLLAVCCLPVSLFGQNEVTVTAQVTPPYSPYLSTYVDQPNKVIVTLINTTNQTQNLRLWIRISGDNGISVTTQQSWKPTEAITLSPTGSQGFIKTLDFTSEQTRSYFDEGHTDLVGITKAQLIQNQALPEGNYTICVRAYDYNTSQPRSMDACSSFPIYYIDPPVAMQPNCATTLTASTPQFVLFSWTPPATAPGNIQYEFTLKEVPNNMNPNDIIKNNVFPVVFNTTQTGNNTLVYNVAQPALNTGKKYVWRVKAVDPNNSVQFKNGGYSEPCYFNYEAAQTAPRTDTVPRPETPVAGTIILKIPANNSTTDAVLSSNTSSVADHYKFEWKPAPVTTNTGAPLTYTLRIAHVSAGQSPAQALGIDSQVVTKAVLGTAYNYTKLSDFVPGETYAWEVKYVQNGVVKHYSDKWTFKVKKNYGKYKVSGKIEYCYTLPAVSSWSSSSSSIISGSIGIPNTAGGQVGTSVNGGALAINNKGTLPYKNSIVAFYKAILVKEGNNPVVAMDGTDLIKASQASGGSPYFQDAGELVGIAFTDENGRFDFSTDEVLGKVYEATAQGKTYNYHKALKVTLGPQSNLYINNPDEYVILEGGTSVEKNFYARVKSFKLKVKFKELPKKDYYNKTQPVDPLSKNITLYVLREKRYPTYNFPVNEGTSDFANNEELNLCFWPGWCTKYAVVAKKKTKTNITTTFEDLVVNDPNNPANDKLYLYATIDGRSEMVMLPQEFRSTDGTSNTCTLNFNDFTFQASSDYEKQYNSGCLTRSTTIIPKMLISSQLSGRLVSHWAMQKNPNDKQNDKADKPIANTKVKLMAYVTKKQADGTEKMVSSFKPELMDVTTTDENGNFKFDVNIFSDSSNKSTLLGSFGFWGGEYYRVLRVVVDNPYYFSPDNSFVIDGGYEYEVGTLSCNVREARLSGVLRDDAATPKPIANQRVYLCRWDGWIDDYVPGDEGQASTVTVPKIYDKDNYEYRVIAETTTDANGKFSFNRLVGAGNSLTTGYTDWPYFVHVQPDELSTNNYITEYPKDYTFNVGMDATGFKQFNSEQFPVALTMAGDVTATALKPTIRGVVHPKSNMGFTTLEGAKVYLLRYTDAEVDWTNTIIPGLMDCCFDGNQSDAYAYLGLGYIQSSAKYKLHATQITGPDGRFVFNDLPTKSIWGSNFHYVVWVEKNGFLTEVVKVAGGAPLLKGQQFPVYIDLRLPVEVKVKVKSYDSDFGVPSKIIVGNAYSWSQTHGINCQLKNYMYICDEEATILCPTGKVKLYVYPENQDAYLPDSFEVTIKQSSNNLAPLEVRERMHDIGFMMYDKNTNALLSKQGAILTEANVNAFKGVCVTQDPQKPILKTNHAPNCQFKSNATDFKFIAFGFDATGVPYVPKLVNVHSNPQYYEGWCDVSVQLERGGTFTGTVKLGTTPVAGARVYVDPQFTGGVPIETTTDASGSYMLSGVPLKKDVVIYAVKQNYIGDKIILSYTSSSGQKYKLSPVMNTYTKNFTIKECNLDIATILGFKVEATDMVLPLNGNIKLSGRFVNLPGNEVVSGTDNSNLTFSNIELKAGSTNGASGKPKAVPVSLPIYTNNIGFPVKVYSTLSGNVIASGWSGVEIAEKTDIIPSGNMTQAPTTVTMGVIKGSLLVNATSFADGIKFNKSYIGARPKGATTSVFDALNSNGAKPVGTMGGFTVEDVSGSNLRFNLFNRYPNAEADKATSTLTSGDVLTLDTKLHTNLNNVTPKDVALAVGKVVFKPKSYTVDINSTKAISIPLGNWSVSSSDWILSKAGGLVMKTGKLNTAVSVPFKNMSLTYTDLMYGEFEFNGMTLGGIVPLTIKSDATRTFGFDKGTMGGTWTFIILPGQNSSYCSSFGNLPGMTGSNQFYIQSIRSFSKTEQAKVELKNGAPPIGIYGVSTFAPGSMDVGADNIAMIGSIDFGIPALAYNSNMKLMWKKTSSGTQLQMPEAPTFSLKSKGIQFNHASSDAYTFSNNLFVLKGVMKDEKTSPNNYAFNVELRKTPGSIKIQTFDANNKFLYTSGGNRGLEKVNGSMSVSGTNWSNFEFTGDMFGMDGGIKESNKKVSMTIKGDIVASPGNKMGVTGVETPMGNMNFVYDFQQQAFVGSSHIGSDIGDQHAEIDMELMIGSGKYYVAGSGEMTFPPDFWIKKASAAFFAGKVSTFPTTVSSMFANFTYDHSTPAFLTGAYTGVAGAFGVKMPIPKVPQFSLNFKPFISMGIEHEISINAITSLNFSETPTLALNASACAYLKAYAGASVGVGCFHLEAAAKAGVQISGEFNKNAASIAGSAELKLSGSGELGVGCCDSDCDHPFYCPCITGGIGVCFSGEIHGNYSTGGGLDIGSDGVGCSSGSCGNQMKCN